MKIDYREPNVTEETTHEIKVQPKTKIHLTIAVQSLDGFIYHQFTCHKKCSICPIPYATKMSNDVEQHK